MRSTDLNWLSDSTVSHIQNEREKEKTHTQNCIEQIWQNKELTVTHRHINIHRWIDTEQNWVCIRVEIEWKKYTVEREKVAKVQKYCTLPSSIYKSEPKRSESIVKEKEREREREFVSFSPKRILFLFCYIFLRLPLLSWLAFQIEWLKRYKI